jgi:hypoxanthine phosphoribosyltransferase
MGMERNIQEHVTLSLLLSREAIVARVKELAIQISRDYAGKDLLLVGVLKGPSCFLRISCAP